MNHVDVEILRLAGGQHGLVTHRQLREQEVSHKAIRHRLDTGALEGVRPDVYRLVGSVATYEQTVLAAVLAAGVTAYASHETALHLWGLRLPDAACLEVTTVLERRPMLKGVRMHRSGLLTDPDVTELNGIPVTTVERAIVDVSSRFDVVTLGRLVDEAVRKGITSLSRIVRLLERLRRAPGRSPKKMQEVLRRRIPGMEERESVLEDFVFDALRRFGFALPVAQHEIVLAGRKRRIDFCYVEHLLALEPKGFDTHRMRNHFDDDALRGNELVLAGYRVLEFTSAFTDWQIAVHVAEALQLPAPERPTRVRTFAGWCLERGVPYRGLTAPNTSVA